MEASLRRRRSGYEPSDTETELHESPRPDEQSRGRSPLPNGSRMAMAMLEMDAPIASPARRRHSKSPYKPRSNASPLSHRTYSDIRLFERQSGSTNLDGSGNACPFSQSERRTNSINSTENVRLYSMSEHRRYNSPLKTLGENQDLSNHDTSLRRRDRSNYNKRAISTPKSRLRTKSQEEQNFDTLGGQSNTTGLKMGPTVGEINEMVANANGNFNDSIDSIFFSRNYNVAFPDANPTMTLPKPPGYTSRNTGANNPVANGSYLNKNGFTNSSSLMSRQSSNISDTSGRTTGSTARFVASRRKSQSETTWFFCIKRGSCKTSDKSPEKDRPFDEASFISKAVVVESLRPLWADKHQPVSLTGFTCHKSEALQLQHLATSGTLPHIVLKGPAGTGKKALTMALLRQIYGDPVWNISHDLRYFHILESKPMQVVVPVSSSPHHVELNVYVETKAAYALTALVKQISSEHAVTPEISIIAPTKADYKVMVLYDVDKAAENIQHLIKWIMDCYSHCCRLILCCEDDADILDSLKTRSKLIHVEASTTQQVMEVLIQIAKKEGFELSRSFAAKIANKSKQNLRRAIMALEACKLHNYPFAEDQHIPVGWEEAIVELAADILANPFPNRLFTVRGKIQKILAEFVHPKLILLKLVEQLLRGVDASLKREIYYWYAYYDKRLPGGTSALLKLEEFVAKFMSIYRKSSSNRH